VGSILCGSCDYFYDPHDLLLSHVILMLFDDCPYEMS
jgi:hypothetical protein